MLLSLFRGQDEYKNGVLILQKYDHKSYSKVLSVFFNKEKKIIIDVL